jgi:hypothetical protein
VLCLFKDRDVGILPCVSCVVDFIVRSICGSNGRVVALRKSRSSWLRRRSAHEIYKATK